MASWVEHLCREWDREDARAAAGACVKCGRFDYVVLFVENGLARIRCRACGASSTVNQPKGGTMWETITTEGGVELQWVASVDGDGSGLTIQRVGNLVYIDFYDEQSDVAAERIQHSFLADAEALQTALNES